MKNHLEMQMTGKFKVIFTVTILVFDFSICYFCVALL